MLKNGITIWVLTAPYQLPDLNSACRDMKSWRIVHKEKESKRAREQESESKSNSERGKRATERERKGERKRGGDI